MFDHGHFAENFARGRAGKRRAGCRADQAGDFHQPVLDEINAVAGVAFVENFRPAAKCRSWAISRRACSSSRSRLRNKRNGFQRDHGRTLRENGAA